MRSMEQDGVAEADYTKLCRLFQNPLCDNVSCRIVVKVLLLLYIYKIHLMRSMVWTRRSCWSGDFCSWWGNVRRFLEPLCVVLSVLNFLFRARYCGTTDNTFYNLRLQNCSSMKIKKIKFPAKVKEWPTRVRAQVMIWEPMNTEHLQ